MREEKGVPGCFVIPIRRLFFGNKEKASVILCYYFLLRNDGFIPHRFLTLSSK